MRVTASVTFINNHIPTLHLNITHKINSTDQSCIRVISEIFAQSYEKIVQSLVFKALKYFITFCCLPADTHRVEQGRHGEARRADARTKRADLEHLATDELRAAAGDVHGVTVVDAVRGGRARAPAASPGERAPERLAASH